jgi:hypothetical protein
MKRILLLIVTFVTSVNYSQERLPGFSNNYTESSNKIDFNFNSELKSDISTIGLTIANQLMKCCSSWGGTNIYSNIDFENCTKSSTGVYTIPMQVGWQGSLSGTQYWIQGKLIIDKNGNKQWLKIKDSGGFYAGCSNNCIN